MENKRKFIAVLSALSIIAAGTGVHANAAMLTDENGDSCYVTDLKYDINNPSYKKMVDSLGAKIAHEEEFVAYLNDVNKDLQSCTDIEDKAVIHVYNIKSNEDTAIGINKRTYIVESIVSNNDKEARRFDQVDYYWGEDDTDGESYGFFNHNEIFEKYSADEMNDYLNEQGLKAHVVNHQIGNKSKFVVHYDDTSEESVVTTFLALNKKFGAQLLAFAPVTENNEVYYDLLLGDATDDGKFDIRDAAFISKKLAEGKIAELPESADYNMDGEKNIRDAAAIAKDLAKN